MSENTQAKVYTEKFMSLKYEQYVEWDKNELAECILDLNEDIKEYRSRIRLLESKISKLRGKL